MRIRTLIVGLVAGLLTMLPMGAAGAADTGTVTVIHGVPGATVDVYVNGDLTLEGFEPKTITDPLELPAGAYDVEIRAAGDPADADPIISGSTELPAGANASIVAHLAADGSPTLSVFVNDVSTIAAGESRLVVRHTAAAPAVDVLADGSALITDLENPDEAQADVPAGRYEAAVAPAGTTDPVIGPADLGLDEGTAYFVYAIGSLDEGNLGLLVQTIAGLHDAPGGVFAGDGGLADNAVPVWIVVTVALGLIVAAGSATVLVRQRAR